MFKLIRLYKDWKSFMNRCSSTERFMVKLGLIIVIIGIIYFAIMGNTGLIYAL